VILKTLPAGIDLSNVRLLKAFPKHVRSWALGFARARFEIVGTRERIQGTALVDTGAWYTALDRGLAERLGVELTGLTVVLTTFPGQRMKCEEGLVRALTLEGRTAPSELVAVCVIPEPVRELLRRQGVSDQVVIGVHTLERLGYAVDVITHRLVESPGILMI